MTSQSRFTPDMITQRGALRRSGAAALGFLIFCLLFVPALWIQNRQLNEVRTKPRLYQDSLYLPSGKSIRLISIGYDRFVADFIWLRSIQAFGGRWGSDRNYRPIFHLFDVITDLDPSFIDAYTFGNLVIGDEGGDQRLGLELINKGMWKNPLKYQLPYWGGYVAYWQLNDPNLAKFYYSRAIKCPDSPGFVSRIIAYMELKSGRYHVAFEKLLQDWLMAIDNNDDVVEGIVQSRIPDILIEWHLFILNQAAEEYIQSMGKAPESLDELEKANVIEPYPYIDVRTLSTAIAQYRLIPGKMIDRLTQIMEMATIPDYAKLPVHPKGFWYQLNPTPSPGGGNFALDGEKIISDLRTFLSSRRRNIFFFHYFNNRMPYTLKEFFPTANKEKDSFGGDWDYLPGLGIFYSTTMPVY